MAVIELVQGDITTLSVDAVVNAANVFLAGGGGVDGAIHRAAGEALGRECLCVPADAQGVRCPTGAVRITGAGRMPCRFIFHTAGPVYRRGGAGERGLLAACYRNALLCAAGYALESVAFPNIGCGVYGWPLPEAANIATGAVRAAAEGLPELKKVVFCCFDKENYELYQRLLSRTGPVPLV